MVVVVGIDPTSWAYEARAHPSTPYNPNRFGVTTGNRTQTKRITISVANRYNMATPKQFTTYKNTFNFSSMLAQRTFRYCQVTETVTATVCGTCPVKNVYIYGSN